MCDRMGVALIVDGSDFGESRIYIVTMNYARKRLPLYVSAIYQLLPSVYKHERIVF